MFILPRFEPTTVEELCMGAAELSCARIRKKVRRLADLTERLIDSLFARKLK